MPAGRRPCLAVRSGFLRQGGLLQGFGNRKNRRCRLARYRNPAVRALGVSPVIGRSSSTIARNYSSWSCFGFAHCLCRRGRACPRHSDDFSRTALIEPAIKRTARSRLARALMAINEWCRINRHLPIPAQRDRLAAKLVGHYGYYGIGELHAAATVLPTGQQDVAEMAGTPLAQERNSRGRNSCRSWRAIRFAHRRSCSATPLSAKLSQEEPDAVVLRIRICGG